MEKNSVAKTWVSSVGLETGSQDKGFMARG